MEAHFPKNAQGVHEELFTSVFVSWTACSSKEVWERGNFDFLIIYQSVSYYCTYLFDNNMVWMYYNRTSQVDKKVSWCSDICSLSLPM